MKVVIIEEECNIADRLRQNMLQSDKRPERFEGVGKLQMAKCMIPGNTQPERSSGNFRTAKQFQSRFLVKTRDKLISIPTDEIAVFYSDGRLNFIKTKDQKKYILPHSIETLIRDLLDPQKFFRVNRSTIIAFNDIKDMYSYFGGRIKLELNTVFEKEIIVSRDKVSEFKKWLGE